MLTDPKSINVGETERLLSMFGAGVFATCGLLRGSLTFMTLGAGLAYRGFTGHCHVYEALGQNTADQDNEPSRGEYSNENWNQPSRVILSE
jgi:hypothetical protein